jgi:tRNA nucleotidyltransferase/poly(A) polymerase
MLIFHRRINDKKYNKKQAGGNQDLEIPEQVKYILETLNDAGFEAYIVGGCVRDQLIGKMPEDWDITTSATPAQIKLLFNNTADTGIRHGTVSVLFPYGCGQVSEKDKACNYKKYEITTFRADGAYEDARRPSEVKFLKSLPGDLARRDFTINAMAWHPETGLIDPFKGADDIRAKIIRTVGKAEERFGEDALRMLRAVRFAARLGFTLHEHVLAGMAQNAALILNISQERIRDELTGILMSHKPEMLSILMSTGILHYILPESAVKREDGVKFVIRALKYEKVAKIENIFKDSPFKDADKISEGLKGHVAIATGLQIIKGYDGAFYPQDEMTRAAAAVMIYNYLQK